MRTITADRLATLLPGAARLSGRKLVRRPALMGGASTLGGNLSLALFAHAGKAAPATGRAPR